MNKQRIDELLNKYNFRTDYERLTKEVFDSITKDARLALEGTKTSIQMIDTRYLQPVSKTNERVLTIDVGGTNTRKTIISFDNEGHISSGEISKTKTDLLMKGDFFENLAEFALPYTKDITSIALCFSYPFSPTDDGDGIINAGAKGVEVTSLKNKPLVKTLIDRLEKKGMKGGVKGTVINDAVASLFNLSLQDDDDDIKIGSILGTGCNVSIYIQKEGKRKAICTETGHAALTSSILSEFDKYVDQETNAQGLSNFEGATSGYYLFRLVRSILYKACEENVFTGDEKQYVQNVADNLDEGYKIDNIFLSGTNENIKYIADKVIHRASAIVGGMFSAFALLSKESRSEMASNVSILIEGTTYYKTNNYKLYVENITREFLKPFGMDVKFYAPYEKEAPAILLGTAISTL